MRNFTWILACCVLALVVGIITACDTTNTSGPMPNPEPIAVAVPFVEAVHIPTEIHAGQPFTIEFDISCAQQPETLRGLARPFSGQDLLSDMTYVGVKLYRQASNIDASAPFITSVTIPVSALLAGQRTLSYTSALSREQGGMLIIIDQHTMLEVNGSHDLIHEQTLTVLP